MAAPFPERLGWTPYYYLFYVLLVIAQPFLDHANATEWTVTLVSLALFFPCYVCVYRRPWPGGVWYAAALALLGFATIPFNPGACCYVVYSGASLGFVLNPAPALRFFLALLSLLALEFWLLHIPTWYIILILFVTAAVSLSNIQHGADNRSNARLRMANDEIAHLAKVAERERIARDLHDVLGHTLSVIVLKSELAGKLLERDPARAHTEIQQVEQVARQALCEVRQAIGGYRAASLAEEFARAKETLETAGVATEYELPAGAPKLAAPQEALLALIVREAVTNIVRHAGAAHCKIALSEAANGWRLLVSDDGRGGATEEGNGLRGMRERVQAIGGDMKCESKRGTTLDFYIPRRMPREATA